MSISVPDIPSLSLTATAARDGSAKSRVLRTLVRDGTALLLLALLAELLLQVTAPWYRHNRYDREFTGSQPIEMNPLGYRGASVPLRNGEAEVRVLALGDSVTFGSGVAADETWPAVLCAALERRTGRPATAINAGLPGVSLKQCRNAFISEWSRYKAGVVVLAVSGNMVSLAWSRRDEPDLPVNPYKEAKRPATLLSRIKSKVKRLRHRLCLPSFLSVNCQRVLYWLGLLDHRLDPRAPFGPLVAFGWQQGDVGPGVAEEAWHQLEGDLLSLRDELAARQVDLLVTFTPCRFSLSERLRDNEKAIPRSRLSIDPERRLRRICERHGVNFVPALSAFRERRARIAEEEGRFAPMFIPFHYNHFDPDGHEALAHAILEHLPDLGFRLTDDGGRPPICSR